MAGMSSVTLLSYSGTQQFRTLNSIWLSSPEQLKTSSILLHNVHQNCLFQSQSFTFLSIFQLTFTILDLPSSFPQSDMNHLTMFSA
ncbi:hypothetical protein ID866_11939 [Astraeus odoratus]|nr:hypothetical protein ID866_11939 [Astraeus odoratus]